MANPSSLQKWFRSASFVALILVTVLDLGAVGFLFYSCANGISPLVIFFFGCIVALFTIIIGIIWIVKINSNRKMTSRPVRWLMFSTWLLILCGIGLMPFTMWPLHFVFTFQHRQLTHLANRIAGGDIPKMPVFLGFYCISGAEVKDGIVCLYTCPQGGKCEGLMRCTEAEVPKHFHNLDTDIELSPNWRYIEED